MNRRVFPFGLLLLSLTVAAACNTKSSSTSKADKQAAADLQAERQKLEDERTKLEAERKLAEEERKKLEAERVAKNTASIPGTSTPATSIHSCTRTGGNMTSRGATCENFYNFTAAEITQYQTRCTAQQNIPNLPIPIPMGSAGTWGTAECATNLNGVRVGGCRSQDSKYVIWYYAPASAQQAQYQCMMQGMTFVN